LTWALIQSRFLWIELSKRLRSAKHRAINELGDIDSSGEIPVVLQRYVDSSFGRSDLSQTDDWQVSLGRLRSQGHPQLAADLESLAYRARHASHSMDDQRLLVENAIAWIDNAESIRSRSSRLPRIVRQKLGTQATSIGGKQVAGLLIAAMMFNGAATTTSAASSVVLLDRDQQKTLFAEANEAYQDGLTQPEEVGRVLFDEAARKYQQIVDSGVQNGHLFSNLANAYFQTGDLGRAIANYRRSIQFSPLDWRSQSMLLLAQSRAALPISRWHVPILWLAVGMILWMVGLGLLAVSFRSRWRLVTSLITLAVSLLCLTIVYQEAFNPAKEQAIAVTETITLREGEGASFGMVAELSGVVGQSFEVKQQRGQWWLVQSDSGIEGWVRQDTMVKL
jgi:tetratricopeptide (TPR) repeat protein